ncbi:hypothetical protein [Thermomonospora umbrina]|nr:hypothetical protein [Thermomonospora umbrina]
MGTAVAVDATLIRAAPMPAFLRLAGGGRLVGAGAAAPTAPPGRAHGGPADRTTPGNDALATGYRPIPPADRISWMIPP